MMERSYDGMMLDLYTKACIMINNEIGQFGISIHVNNTHVVDRAKDRCIDIQFVSSTLRNFTEKHICEFVFLASFPEKKRPFRIELRDKDVIIVLSRFDEKKWKFNTVLDPRIHSLHDDEKPGTFHNRIKI